MDIIELVIDSNEDLNGIDAISLVENPAIEENFIALKTQEVKFASVDKERRILMGAALIPDKPIYRNSNGHEFYIFFSKETVSKASQLFFQKGNQSNATLEHEKAIKGLTVVESWIIEDEVHDKSRKYGLSMPLGTWMVSMKVEDDAIWNDYVKSGKVKGFSIEGFFADKLEGPNDKLKENLKEMSVEEKLIEELKNIVLASERVTLGLDDDLKSAGQKAQSIFNDGRKSANASLSKAAGEMDAAKKKIQSLEKEISGEYARSLKIAKEIGVDLDGTTVGKNFKRVFSEIEDYVMNSREASRKIEKFKI